MKFNHGHWQKEKGMECLSPVEQYDTSFENDGTVLKICAPVRKIYNRGCTLNVPVITIRISIPAPGVYTIRLTHFEGQKGYVPSFCIDAVPEMLDVHCEGGSTVIENDGAKLIIKEDMTMEFYQEERYLTRIKPKDIMYVRQDGHGEAYISPDDINYMCASTNLSVDEHIYGLGERFTAFVKNGQVVQMWNDDGGTSTQLSYKNVPFYMSDRGYGVFVNNTGKVEYEVGSEIAQRVQFSVLGESLEFSVICGADNEYGRMKDVLVKYTGLTGRPPVLPAWSFGLWLSTSVTTDYDEKTVKGFIDE
ncbi:MAG: alpha-xylosidase, partial [Lachnospiraceae bacterium]|nr:alpha-xylosidase [Lachnospiraceae bacterium]